MRRPVQPEWGSLSFTETQALTVQAMQEFKMLQVLHHAGAYTRRVCRPMQDYPLRLLMLGKSSPTVDCADRRAVAREILTGSPKVDTNGRKLQSLFPEALAAASEQGICTMGPWSFIATVRCHLKADVQACEGFNSLIKTISSRSPSISLPILNSRLQLKKALGVCSLVVSMRSGYFLG